MTHVKRALVFLLRPVRHSCTMCASHAKFLLERFA